MSKSYARRTAKNDPKGDRRSRTISPEPAQEPPLTALPFAPVPERLTSSQALYELLTRGDGWVRATATLDMKTAYLKYKYTSGTWKGHYVMAVVVCEELQRGLQLLVAKVNQVDLGILRPAKDTPYDA
jgi:hypothetical protein